ncbi:MAG: hypothetical protein JW720_08970 [Sedimentisphaerales bacterium]|nr:hypothetical protein [Sedimentisphaerales bacterium]
MAILVGIDEAGFGPILGPLVVSSSTFSLPAELLRADMWQILRKSVGKTRRHLAGRLVIADSKKAYSRSRGIGTLERTILASLRCLGAEPATLNELLMLLCPTCFERLREYPWYESMDEHLLDADAADGKIAASVFADDLSGNSMKLVDLSSYCFDVAHYNRMVSSVKNKANVLFTATATLIKRALNNSSDDDLQVMVDRQGGRVHYRESLQRMFADMHLTILQETPAVSSYQLTAGAKRMRVHFAVGADERFLPVSLASMLSKYLRELLIASINRYFAAFGANLKPTAGYWKDGWRFIKEVREHLPHVSIDDNRFIRCR